MYINNVFSLQSRISQSSEKRLWNNKKLRYVTPDFGNADKLVMPCNLKLHVSERKTVIS